MKFSIPWVIIFILFIEGYPVPTTYKITINRFSQSNLKESFNAMFFDT